MALMLKAILYPGAKIFTVAGPVILYSSLVLAVTNETEYTSTETKKSNYLYTFEDDVTINNVNFNAEAISADACIRLGDGTNATRYTCNVTVEGCTFDVPGAVAVKSYTGGDKNLTISKCTATAKAHSMLQAKGIDGILVEEANVYSKNGLNFNNSNNVVVNNSNVDVKGYAVRFGEGSAATGGAETYTITNSIFR